MKAQSFYSPNKSLLISLSKELKSIRKAKGLTIEDLSDKAGLHEKYIQTIERNHRNISISVFVQIAKALNVSAPNILAKAMKAKAQPS